MFARCKLHGWNEKAMGYAGRTHCQSLSLSAHAATRILHHVAPMLLPLCPASALPLCSHVNALTLGHALGVDAVLMPPAWSRTPDSFNQTKHGQHWAKDNPVSSLLDLQAMADSWAQRGIRLLEVCVA